jgi:signal transduction histidine kinase
MKTDNRLPLSLLGFISVVILGTTFLLVQPGTLGGFITTGDFQPHAYCFTWQPDLMMLYVVSDSFITFSYIFISALLVYFVYRTRDRLPMPWIFLAFGAFIVSCGITHFFDILTLWNPIYWVSGTAKFITAVASSVTAFSLPYAVPRALNLVKQANLSEQRKQAMIKSYQELQREIEHRKQVEAELTEALAAERKFNQFQQNFITTMSHEFRTPLAIILTSSQILERYNQKLTDEQRQDKFHMIKAQIQHIDLLLNGILTIQNIENNRIEFNPTAVQIKPLLAQNIENIQTTIGENHVIHFEFIDCPDEITADEQLLQTIFFNLLQNAVKFSPEASQIHVELCCDSDYTIIKVRDEGRGIAEDEQAQIFQSFYRGENAHNIQGTGLGLAIVKNAVDLHTGQIMVESQSDKGTTFTVKIPHQQP